MRHMRATHATLDDEYSSSLAHAIYHIPSGLYFHKRPLFVRPNAVLCAACCCMCISSALCIRKSFTGITTHLCVVCSSPVCRDTHMTHRVEGNGRGRSLAIWRRNGACLICGGIWHESSDLASASCCCRCCCCCATSVSSGGDVQRNMHRAQRTVCRQCFGSAKHNTCHRPRLSIENVVALVCSLRSLLDDIYVLFVYFFASVKMLHCSAFILIVRCNTAVDGFYSILRLSICYRLCRISAKWNTPVCG